jgi:hypothetical protein
VGNHDAHAVRDSHSLGGTSDSGPSPGPAAGLQWRHYRETSRRQAAWVVTVLFIVVYGGENVSEDLSPGASIIGDVWSGLVLLVALALILWVGYRVTMSEDDRGLVTRSFRIHVVAWEEIVAFVVPEGQPLWWRTVYAECRSHRRVALAVMQGRRVVWEGAETHDIVSVLVDRLNEVRAARGLEPLANVEQLPPAWRGLRSSPPARLPSESTIARVRRERRARSAPGEPSARE